MGVAAPSERLNASVPWAETARQGVVARHATVRRRRAERSTGVALFGELP